LIDFDVYKANGFKLSDSIFDFQCYKPKIVALDKEPKISELGFKVLGPYGCPAGCDENIRCFSSLEEAENARDSLWIPGLSAREVKSVKKAGNTIRILNYLGGRN